MDKKSFNQKVHILKLCMKINDNTDFTAGYTLYTYDNSILIYVYKGDLVDKEVIAKFFVDCDGTYEQAKIWLCNFLADNDNKI